MLDGPFPIGVGHGVTLSAMRPPTLLGVSSNLVIASTFITVLVLWDLLGHLVLPLGVAGHEGSTVLVGLNGMRLLARRAWAPTPRVAGRNQQQPA